MILWWSLLGLAAASVGLLGLAVASLLRVQRQGLPPPKSYPGVSVIKPLCGLDEDLWRNLESHLEQSYAGEWELLLGVSTVEDPAFEVATRFAQAHSEHVRVVVQERVVGSNRKVNQFIGLTQAARHDVLVFVDSNVRVSSEHLTELVAALEPEGIGVAFNSFVGVGEQKLGAVLDNLTLALFLGPPLALALRLVLGNPLVGKSLALKRVTLERLGGWRTFRNILAEDHQLGHRLYELGLRSTLCPTPVLQTQRQASFRVFWERQVRWSTIRFHLQLPLYLMEPALVPSLWGWALVALAPTFVASWVTLGALLLVEAALSQQVATRARGEGFSIRHLCLVPIRDVLLFFVWIRAMTKRHITWRGTRLRVLAKTRLADPKAFIRLRRMRMHPRLTHRQPWSRANAAARARARLEPESAESR